MSVPSRTTLRSRVAGSSHWLRNLAIGIAALIVLLCAIGWIRQINWSGPAAPVAAPNAAQNSLLNLVAKPVTDGIELSWAPMSGATAYRLTRDGELIATLPGTQISYKDAGVKPGNHVYGLEPVYDQAAPVAPAAEKEQPSTNGGTTSVTFEVPEGAGDETVDGNPLDNK